MANKGTCEKHGEFLLDVGCVQCIADAQADKPMGIELAKTDPDAWRTGEEEQRLEPDYPPELDYPPDGSDKELEQEPEISIALKPGEDLEVRGHYNEALELLKYAEDRVIATVEDDKLASDDLIVIGTLKKVMEAKRVELVKPKQDEVKAIQETYKTLMEPVENAYRITRDKMTVFKLEQQRIAQAANELNRRAQELAREQAAMNNGEFTVDLKPVKVETAPRLTRTDMGVSGLVDSWQYEVIDIDLLPREYMIPDDVMLKATAKKYHDRKPVAGVRFYNDPHIATRRTM